MPSNPLRFESLDDLRRFVSQTLCDEEVLDPKAYPLDERVLHRGSQPCGMLFCLHGPRAMLISAIWETDHNTILFYGSSGARFRRVQLEVGPELNPIAA